MWLMVTLIFVCSYLAFSVSSLCGGGAGLILIPILGGLLPISQVPAALSIGTFTSSASRIAVFHQNIRWDIVKYFVPAALPAVWIGAKLLVFVNPVYLEIAIGLFLVGNLPFLFKKSDELANDTIPARIFLVFVGAAAGFLSGLTGAVGLLFNRYYLRYGLSNQEIVATRAANEIILHLIKVVLYTLFGLVSKNSLSLGLAIAVSAMLSAWTMKWILPRLSQSLFKKIGYSAMVISGFVMLGQSGGDILSTNRGAISTKLIVGGIETRLQWQNANFSLEYTYNDGFSFEQVVTLAELSAEDRAYILSQRGEADKIVVENIYLIGSRSHEAYYFDNQKLINKITFD